MTVKSWEQVKADLAERDRRHQARPWPVRWAVDGFWRVRWALVRALTPGPWWRLHWRAQRARRGWSDRDAWNVDRHVAAVTAGCVRRLLEVGHICPEDFTEDEWANYLTGIAEPLETYADKAAWDVSEAECKAAEDALRRFADRLGDMWD